MELRELRSGKGGPDLDALRRIRRLAFGLLDGHHERRDGEPHDEAGEEGKPEELRS